MWIWWEMSWKLSPTKHWKIFKKTPCISLISGRPGDQKLFSTFLSWVFHPILKNFLQLVVCYMTKSSLPTARNGDWCFFLIWQMQPTSSKKKLIFAFYLLLASNVNLVIQLENGERLQHHFHPSTTLYDVLKQMEGDPGRCVAIKRICIDSQLRVFSMR